MKTAILIIMILGIAGIACAGDGDFDGLISDYLCENWGEGYTVHGAHEFYRVWIPQKEGEYIYIGMFLHRGTTIFKCLGCVWCKGGQCKLNAIYQIGEETVY
jgi:hypothetical protein